MNVGLALELLIDNGSKKSYLAFTQEEMYNHIHSGDSLFVLLGSTSVNLICYR